MQNKGGDISRRVISEAVVFGELCPGKVDVCIVMRLWMVLILNFELFKTAK